MKFVEIHHLLLMYIKNNYYYRKKSAKSNQSKYQLELQFKDLMKKSIKEKQLNSLKVKIV